MLFGGLLHVLEKLAKFVAIGFYPSFTKVMLHISLFSFDASTNSVFVGLLSACRYTKNLQNHLHISFLQKHHLGFSVFTDLEKGLFFADR